MNHGNIHVGVKVSDPKFALNKEPKYSIPVTVAGIWH